MTSSINLARKKTENKHIIDKFVIAAKSSGTGPKKAIELYEENRFQLSQDPRHVVLALQSYFAVCNFL